MANFGNFKSYWMAEYKQQKMLQVLSLVFLFFLFSKKLVVKKFSEDQPNGNLWAGSGGGVGVYPSVQ